MIGGENKMDEKPAFNGNLALLRVCTIIFIVNMLGYVLSMFFMAGRHGGLASLWSALTTSSFEDLLGMVGMLFVSGILGPLGLGVLAYVALLGLAIYVFVKKNATALKILAVLMILLTVLGPFILNYFDDFQNFAPIAVGMVFNANIVVIVAAFFVAPKKHVEESKEVITREGFNLGLYRLCAAYFLVYGLGGTMTSIVGYGFFLSVVIPSCVAVLVGIFALVKKNTDVLTSCAVLMMVLSIWRMFQFPEWLKFSSSGLTFFMVMDMVIRYLFNSLTVVCVATFFIEPERTRTYFRKVKSLFAKQK